MTEPTWLNPGFRILKSRFLHTSFVDFDFTVAKIITILPIGYRAQLLYASYCFYRGETTLLEGQHHCADGVRRYVSRTSIVELSASQSRSRQPFLCSESILQRFFAPPGPLSTVSQYAPQFSLSERIPLGRPTICTHFLCLFTGTSAIVAYFKLCAGLRRALCSFRGGYRWKCVSSTGTARPTRFPSLHFGSK